MFSRARLPTDFPPPPHTHSRSDRCLLRCFFFPENPIRTCLAHICPRMYVHAKRLTRTQRSQLWRSAVFETSCFHGFRYRVREPVSLLLLLSGCRWPRCVEMPMTVKSRSYGERHGSLSTDETRVRETKTVRRQRLLGEQRSWHDLSVFFLAHQIRLLFNFKRPGVCWRLWK